MTSSQDITAFKGVVSRPQAPICLQVLFLEGIVKQLSQDLSQAEMQLKAAESDKAAAGREHPGAAQQAMAQQVKALNARVCSLSVASTH